MNIEQATKRVINIGITDYTTTPEELEILRKDRADLLDFITAQQSEIDLLTSKMKCLGTSLELADEEIERLHSEIIYFQKCKDIRNNALSTSEYCRKYLYQQCHKCEDAGCCDNTNPSIVELKAENERLREDLRLMTGVAKQSTNDVAQFLNRLKEKYEKQCPECDGKGTVPVALLTSDITDIKKSALLQDDCPNCKGTGRIARCFVPKVVVEIMQYGYMYKRDKEQELDNRLEILSPPSIYNKPFVHAPSLPQIDAKLREDGIWELSEVKE